MDKVISQTIDVCINEFNKTENKSKVEENVLDPIIQYIGNRLWPYIVYLIIIMVIIICSLLYVIYTVNKKSKVI